MLGLTKNTVDNLLYLVIAAAISHAIIYIPWVGNYVQTQPLYMIGGAVILIALANKIADNIKFMDRQLVKNYCYLLGGIGLFYGLAALPQAKELFQQQALIVTGISLLALAFKDTISTYLGGN